jgi:arabinofuranan 3-O-arabinosyltransferase
VTRINAGSNRVTEPSSDSFDVQDVVLELHHGPLLDGGQAIQPGRPEVLSWTSSRRIVRLATDQASYLAVNENFNPGWVAVAGARTLRPIRLDGWKQGWVLPAGTRGIVTLTYAPDSTYRPNLLIGLGAVSLIMAAAVAPVGRLRRRGELVPVGTEPELVAPLEIPDPLLSRWSASRMLVLLIAGLALLLAVGLWLGGNSGAIVMPVAGAAFFAAVAFSDRSTICRMAGSPWVMTCLLIAAALMNAIGVQLRHGGHVTVTSAVLADAGPQLLCLVIVARLIVALLVTATEGGATPGNDPPVPRVSLPQAPPAVRALSRDRLCLPPRPGQPER